MLRWKKYFSFNTYPSIRWLSLIAFYRGHFLKLSYKKKKLRMYYVIIDHWTEITSGRHTLFIVPVSRADWLRQVHSTFTSLRHAHITSHPSYFLKFYLLFFVKRIWFIIHYSDKTDRWEALGEYNLTGKRRPISEAIMVLKNYKINQNWWGKVDGVLLHWRSMYTLDIFLNL